MSRNCYLRFIAPEFDGYGDVRKSSSGGSLPEPRFISLQIFKNDSKLSSKVTFLFVLFGQLIAHDLARAVRPFKTKCCDPKNSNNPECMPIKVSPDDPFYSKYNKTCIDFHRSEECKYCVQATRAQTNGATAAMDASWLYGENEEKAKELRFFNGKGQLKFEEGDLPIVGVDKEDEFCYEGQESKCILNGDPRVNQHSSLTSSMTVWLREHNRVARELKILNPDWEEEKLFQEARKIVIAEFQCIAYKDFLPTLLGARVMKQFGTYIENGSVGTNYDPTVVIGVWNEFSIAAFRLHSLIPSDIGYGNMTFKDTFSNPDLVRKGHASDLLRGSFGVSLENYDHYMVDDVTKYLYLKYQDLASINIQRGRDHGLPPYVKAIKFCSAGSVKVQNFDDLRKLGLMTRTNARLLNQTYENVNDIDMWVGMQMEKHMSGSMLGPTAVCIIAKQTFFTMHGDRFFFNHEGPIPAFTEDQRIELKKCSLARVLCDNTNITEITKNPFFLPKNRNPKVSCEEIPKINLTLWKESSGILGLKFPKIALPDSDNPNLPFGLSL
ncbi:Peroxidase like protein [Argiope bruennichi]|uniref:Peroxidase like protein n=2 Tax=Argiope bruennichi TaxID=94029 RepID=A0A8T0EH65_ARGBR|nr:Peroxidase like protein [Argiope bruennichi]